MAGVPRVTQQCIVQAVSSERMYEITSQEIGRLVAAIDYSEALTIAAGEEDARAACRAAANYHFRAVVAFPQYLSILVDELKGSGVRAQIPISFPCGGTDRKSVV